MSDSNTNTSTILPVLENIKSKLSTLLSSLDTLLSLHPSESVWNSIVSHVNLILSQYASVWNELNHHLLLDSHNSSTSSSTLLNTTLLAPYTLPPQDPDFMPRVLLRSRLIPSLTDSERLDISSLMSLSSSSQKELSTEELQNKLSRQKELLQNVMEMVFELKEEMNSVLKLNKNHLELKSSKHAVSKSHLEDTLLWMSQG